MKLIKYLLLIVLLYLYIYNPIFLKLGFGSVKVVLIISVIYLFFSDFIPRFLYLFKDEILLTLFLISYSVFLSVIGENTTAIPYSHLIWFLEGFLIPVFLIIFFKDVFERYSWESLVVQVGFIASLITFFLILNPSTNQFIRESVIDDPLDNIITASGNLDFRGFSIAESSTYGYGIVQGLILSICIFSMKKNIKFIIPILFLLLSVFFNARTGIIAVLISLFLLFIYGRLKTVYLLSIPIVILIGYLYFQYSSFGEQNESSIEWAFSIFIDFQNFVNGTGNSTGFDLLSAGVHFPSEIVGLFFGTGESVFSSSHRQSDIGFIIQIYRGGLIYLSIMLFFLWKMYKKCIKNSSDKLLSIVFVLTILAVNIKGNAFFTPNSFQRLFLLYYVYITFEKSVVLKLNSNKLANYKNKIT